jgi:formylglycine-generating enzyme required for sulfatase activity
VRISAAGAIVFAALPVTSLHSSPTDPLTGMPFVRIEAGTFMMGTPPNEPQREAHEVQHRVTIARPFYLGRHEVHSGRVDEGDGLEPVARSILWRRLSD